MSSVYLHIGQCGVQIGYDFWCNVVAQAQYDKDVKSTLWSHVGGPQCLFIDGEKKVVRKLINDTKKLKVVPSLNVAGNSICCRKGCGSNWALGYHGLGRTTLGNDLPNIKAGFGKFIVDRDSSMLEVCMEAIRVKVETCDSFSGFLGINSLGGGTGSGWGSKLCEELRDLYPTAYRLWNVVTPHSSGESPTQHYNQLLSLAKLQENSDAVVLYHNDEILECLSRQQPSKSVSLRDLNCLIAKTMASLFLPISLLTPPSGGLSIGIEPWELIRSVAPMPSYKFLQTRYVDESMCKSNAPNIWDKLTRKVVGQIRNSSLASHESAETISALGVCRGSDRNLSPNIGEMSKKLKAVYNCVDWNPFPIDIWYDKPKISLKGASKRPVSLKSLAVCANSTSVRSYLKTVADKSKLMFDSKAYLHWYARHGTPEQDFIEAFNTMRSVITEYKL